MKRQRSRNRGGGSGGGKPQHNANRAFESNGPDGVKIRGAAQHVFEKYQQLARDALTAGDRVLGESYQQHAEHYFRVLRAVQPQRPPSDIIGRDSFTSGIDIDFEDESGENEGGQEVQETEADRGEWRQENRQDNRQEPRQDNRYEGRRDDRPQRDQRNFNDQRPRQDQQRDDRPRDDRQRDDRPRQEQQRDDRPRQEQPREDRPQRERFREDRGERRADRADRAERNADPLAVVEPHAAPLTQAPEAEQPSSPVLRSQDGGTSQAPAFLQARVEPPKPEGAEEGEPRPRARRRRAPRSFEGAAGESGDAAPSGAGVSEEA
jgi:hypothetical protein